MTTEEKKRILDAIGLTFLIRLLKSGTHSGSHKFLIMSTCMHSFYCQIYMSDFKGLSGLENCSQNNNELSLYFCNFTQFCETIYYIH